MQPLSADPTAASASHHLLGTTLRGTYRILRALDQGGMGIVFEAEHARLHRRVAVKVLAKHLITDAQAIERFHREADIVSQLQHPNIVQIIDFDTTDEGEPYIVMEFLQGESLAARLERERCLPIQDAVRISYQVASALAAAHENSIVHRDLKPANIFLMNVAGQGTLVKLLDFGISKRAGVGRKLTGEHDILGTPDYMAPEQATGRTATVDHRADQYALSVITYEALSGQTPFPGDEVWEVLRQVIHDVPVSVDKIAPHVSLGVSEVVQKAMSKDPAERYRSVGEFADALLCAAGCSLPPPVETRSAPITMPAPSPNAGRMWSMPSGAKSPGAYRSSHPEPSAELEVESHTAIRVAPASTQHSPSDLNRILEQARQALDLGDLDLAVSYAESALRSVELSNQATVPERVEAEASMLERIFILRIGPLSSELTVQNIPSETGRRLRVSPQQAYLLSRIDNGITVEEVLDLSPLPRLLTLRHLVALLRAGFIAAA